MMNLTSKPFMGPKDEEDSYSEDMGDDEFTISERYRHTYNADVEHMADGMYAGNDQAYADMSDFLN